MLFTISNSITIIRMILILPIISCDLFGFYNIGWSLMLICVATDTIDGYYARKFDNTSTFGGLLDSYADKMFVITMFMLLISKGILTTKVQLFSCFIIVLREFLVLLIRVYRYQNHQPITTSYISKIKTGLSFLTILTLMYPCMTHDQIIIGNMILYLTAILSIISMKNGYFCKSNV